MEAGTGADSPRRRRPRQRRATVTIKDVATLSGVSSATVTRALQGSPRVLPETRRKVVEAAEQLGYRPNESARTLVTGMSRTVGLLIPAIGDPYWAEVAEGVEQRAAEREFSVLFGSGHGDGVRAARMLDVFYGKRVDGVMIATSAGAEDTAIEAFVGVPVVIVGWDPPVAPKAVREAATEPPDDVLRRLRRRRPRFPNVAFDDAHAGQLAALHLVELGHRSIGFVGGPATLATALRIVGARSVLQADSIDFEHVLTGAETHEDARAVTLELLGRRPRPTALIAFDDTIAVGAIRAARSIGVAVPGDLSIIGFDDIPLAELVDPALTTVRQPKQELGGAALDLLLGTLQSGKPVHADRQRGALVVRASTASAP